MAEMTRRGFLATTGAIAATSLLADSIAGQAAAKAAPAAAAAASGKRTLRKAVMFGMIGEDLSVADKFKLLRDCGFEGVEMDSPGKIAIEEILAAQEATGIRVHGMVDSIHWHRQLNNPDEKVRAEGVAGLETALRDAHRVGSSSVLLVPGVVNAEMPYDQAWRLSMQGIRTVMPLAGELGVTIAVENVWNGFLLSPLEAAAYVDGFQSLAVAWHFDIGNVINFGWPEQWIRILGKRIVKLHIKDFSRTKRDKEGLWKGFDVQLGEGDAGWPAVMKALDETGYSTDPAGRWGTAEVAGGDRARLRQISEQMDKLFAM